VNLADMLSYADIHELSRIATTYDCVCDSHSKNDLIQSILTTVNRKDVFDQRILDLSMEDMRFLNSLLFDPRNSFSLEELMARAQQARFVKNEKETINPRDLIAKFKQHGWLFNGYSQQTKYLFQVPHDLKRRFSDALTRKFERNLQLSEEPQVYRDEGKLLAQDLLLFLRAIHQQSIPVTADGSMYKRALQQILESLSLREELPGKTAFRFGYGRQFKEYPNRFSLLYDYCYFQGLLEESSDTLQLTDKGQARLTLNQSEDLAELYRFWLRLYKNPVPNLQSIVYWLERLAKSWVTTSSLSDILCPLIRPFYFDSSEAIFEQRIIGMMMHLGLVRIGEHQTQGPVIQMTKLGSSIVQGIYVHDEDIIPLTWQDQ
jgi:hypothetical protein